MWVFERVADAGLSGHVQNQLESPLTEQPGHRVPIGQVELLKRKARSIRQLSQPVVLELDGVVIVEIVQADDLFATVQQGAREMETNKTRGAGDQNSLHTKWKVSTKQQG